MHNAPAVSYPVGRSVWYAAVLLAFAFLGLFSTVLALWETSLSAWGWRQLVLVVIWLSSVGFGVLSWRRSPQGELRWDGQIWYWTDVPGRVQVGLDAQRLLWIKWSPHDASSRPALWLCLESGKSPLQWMDLRRAVYSPGHVSTHSPSH